ncbi:MAG: tRNA dihydrouridine synthase DusB [Burkholderiaceae bacterium]|nr:tRNA dihydrouridine synthase DusB [Burkholderiaceae bacterium]
MNLGPYTLPNNLFVAPMAGVTDRPFRKLCKALGAGYAVSEMVTSRRDLWDSLKTSRRANHDGEAAPIAVQIAGTEAQMMADAARYNIERGAQIIDINMGCPAKKVCNKWAGSALMQDEVLAIEIVSAVVQACQPHGVPVTLKMRTGWAQHAKNARSLALAAQEAGVAMLTIHGRTREQGYKGFAEHDTVADIKSRVSIPVVANGDVNSPQAAKAVLAATGADAVMVGRAAQGRPWIFREMAHYLASGELLAPPTPQELQQWMLAHLREHHELYGEFTGVRSGRKHLGWYAQSLPSGDVLRRHVNTLTDAHTQLQAVSDYFEAWASEQLHTLPAMWGVRAASEARNPNTAELAELAESAA